MSNIVFSGFTERGIRYFLSKITELTVKSGETMTVYFLPDSRSDNISVHLRIGESSMAPEIIEPEADMLIVRGRTAAVKNIDLLRFGGKLIVIDEPETLSPMPLMLRENDAIARYIEDIAENVSYVELDGEDIKSICAKLDEVIGYIINKR